MPGSNARFCFLGEIHGNVHSGLDFASIYVIILSPNGLNFDRKAGEK